MTSKNGGYQLVIFSTFFSFSESTCPQLSKNVYISKCQFSSYRGNTSLLKHNILDYFPSLKYFVSKSTYFQSVRPLIFNNLIFILALFSDPFPAIIPPLFFCPFPAYSCFFAMISISLSIFPSISFSFPASLTSLL